MESGKGDLILQFYYNRAYKNFTIFMYYKIKLFLNYLKG